MNPSGNRLIAIYRYIAYMILKQIMLTVKIKHNPTYIRIYQTKWLGEWSLGLWLFQEMPSQIHTSEHRSSLSPGKLPVKMTPHTDLLHPRRQNGATSPNFALRF